MSLRSAAWAAALAAVSGCAVTPVATLAEFAERGADNSFEIIDRPVRATEALVLDVPFDHQADRAACGAHVLASVIRYWRRDASETGASIWAATPPADRVAGYSMQELVELARAHRLDAFGVRLEESDIVAELEKGRPVLVPVKAPSVYFQTHTLFDPDPIVIGQMKNLLFDRMGAVSQLMGLEMLSHYVLVVGHAPDRFVLLDPIMGYRTISRSRLAGYRAGAGNAAIVFSLAPQP